MSHPELHAISPIDGRYAAKTDELKAYFSEFALIRYRLMVEVEYLIALNELDLPQMRAFSQHDDTTIEALRDLYRNFTEKDAQKVKAYERKTNHDVKAVEYFLKDALDSLQLGDAREFVHFGLTSQDINNTAFPRMLFDAVHDVYYPILLEVVGRIESLAASWESIPMLARTHGQPASPTRLGKEMLVYAYRLREQMRLLKKVPMSAKFGGATGNFNAHYVAYPKVDWETFADTFVNERLGLQRSRVTTQIDNYDHLAAIFDSMRRIDNILIDFCRDMWTYVSMDYFRQAVIVGEVGSSAMPHKVNPIDFENAEGNLGVANAIFLHLANKLPISRLQRDLTDSTVIRNIGVPIAHCLVAFKSLLRGMDRISVHEEVISRDLEHHWMVVAEGIQTVLRREGYPKPYEALKALTRTESVPRRSEIEAFIDTLDVSDEVKAELHAITPFTYTGVYPAWSVTDK